MIRLSIDVFDFDVADSWDCGISSDVAHCASLPPRHPASVPWRDAGLRSLPPRSPASIFKRRMKVLMIVGLFFGAREKAIASISAFNKFSSVSARCWRRFLLHHQGLAYVQLLEIGIFADDLKSLLFEPAAEDAVQHRRIDDAVLHRLHVDGLIAHDLKLDLDRAEHRVRNARAKAARPSRPCRRCW